MELDNIKNELLSIADTGLKYGLSKAPEADIELYITQEKTIEVEFQGGAVNARDSVLSGVSVRVFDKKRKSFSCSSGYEMDNIKSALDEAIKITKKISHTDERYKQLADPLPPANEGIIDPEILLITSETLSKEALLMVEECKKVDNRLVSISGERSIIAAAFAITNSQGIAAATRITANIGVVSTVAKEGDKQKSGFEFSISRSKDLNIDLKEVGIKAAKDALKLLKSKPLNSAEQIPVVFESLPGSMYFGTAFGSSLTGKAVTEGKSFFADKIGDEVAIKKMTVFDDGQLPEGLSTSAIDGEGIPTQKTSIVENGVLKSFINDSYYGNIMDTQSTGNSKRSGNPEYEQPPQVGTSTISVSPGEKSREDLIGEISKGVLIKGFVMGMGHTNPITGNFSIVCPAPYLIENGSVSAPLEPLNVAGNLYESLKRITGLGNDLFLSPFGVNNPTVVIDGLTVTG